MEKKSIHKIAILVFVLVILGCQSPPKNTNAPFAELTDLIDQYAENTVKHGNINSLSIAVYKNGSSYHNYFAKDDVISDDLHNDNTLYEIASISKVFVGSLMAKAVHEKKVSLDDDIRNYLPREYPNLVYNGTPITIQNLVTHTLGFETPKKLDEVYNKIFDGFYENKIIDYNMDDLFDELETVKLQNKPGTFYDYNNVGPEIVAYILEQVYKKPYKDLLNHFFENLGMENTFLQDYENHKEQLSIGYDEDNKLASIDKNPLLGGAAGIITTLPDLIKFMKFQLESDDPFIKESTRTLYQDDEERMGYFWDLGYAEEEGFYYLKSGTSSRIQSIILLCPESNYGQILLMNNTSEKATIDWISLYNRIEYDLLKYPKINLWSQIEPIFVNNAKEASEKYRELKKDTSRYFSESDYLNRIGYDYLYHRQIKKAIDVFELAISTDPRNPNLYDSLGEAYFKAEEYEKSKINYEKSFELNPDNGNAEKYIIEINRILEKTD